MARHQPAPGGSPNWRWCLRMGLLVTAIDMLTVSLTRGSPPENEVRGVLENFDLIANLAIFAIVGYRTGRQTGRLTAAAEGGVVASLLPGLAAAALNLVPSVEPLAQGSVASAVIGSIALNIVLAGLAALVAGWVATRQPPAR